MTLIGVSTGETTRDLTHPPARVWHALTADPSPEEMESWGIDGFERVSSEVARYVQFGKAVEARLQILEEGRRLRSANTADGGDEEAHEFTLEPIDDGGTRLHVRVDLAFKVPRRRMRETLEAMLDGLEIRLDPDAAQDAPSSGEPAS